MLLSNSNNAGEAITPEEVMDLMEEDVKQCDLILWVGISFQQSASTAYFRNVRRWLQVRLVRRVAQALGSVRTACMV